jgi:hypothetical protein
MTAFWPRGSASPTGREIASDGRRSEWRPLMPESLRLPYLTPHDAEPRLLPDAELRRAMGGADAADISGAAAAVLEHIADRLSWTRGMSIVRERGDGSLADRWPSVANALRKTDADDIAEQITRSPVFRDLVARPRDRSARSVSTAQAKRFGQSVLVLLGHTHCTGCGQWWSAARPGASRWTCHCRSLTVVTRPTTR